MEHSDSPISGDEIVPAGKIAEILILGKSQISDLSKSNVLKRYSHGKYWFHWSLQSIVVYYRDRSTSTAKSQSRSQVQNELDYEKTRNMKLKNLILERAYAPVQLMRDIIASNNGKARVALESVKPRLRQKWGDAVPLSVLNDIDAQLKRALDAMADDVIDSKFEELILNQED